MNTKRGRPLDPSRDVAIIDATIELFAEVGFDQLTMDAVARRAGVGLSTIYRRWESKSDLVAAAIGELLVSDEDDDAPPPTHTEVLHRLCETLGGAERSFYPSVVSAMESDKDVANAVRTHAVEPYRRAMRAHVRRVTGDDTDSDLVRLLADLGPALLVYRSLIVDEPPTPELVVLLEETLDRTLDSYAREREGDRPVGDSSAG